MKIRYLCGALLAAAVAVPASADWHSRMHSMHTYAAPGTARMTTNDGAFHSGGATLDDQALAGRIADAMAADPSLKGATVTIAANRGSVQLSGSASHLQEASRAEQIAADIAGRANVSGKIDVMGG